MNETQSLRYRTPCYETGCPYNHQDGNSPTVCIIKLEKDFKTLCPWQIVRRHRMEETKMGTNENNINYPQPSTTPMNDTITQPSWWPGEGAWTYPVYTSTQLTRDYKCGNCNGEFCFPGEKDGRKVCPFCGKIMEGL